MGSVRPVHADSLPDLTVDNIWLEEASIPGQAVTAVAPGDQFLIVASIKNLGSATASGYYVDVYYDSSYGRGGPDNIAPGETQIWYVVALTAQTGSHTTKWMVDPDNQIAESNEVNNEKDYTFAIGSQATDTTTTTSNTTTQVTTTTTKSSTTSTTLTLPIVTVPADMTVEATGPSGAVVKFTASASDVADGSLTPTCTPSSGSAFALGSATVTCTVTDRAGLTGSASFKVTVVDKTPPTITVPADMTVKGTSSSGATVKYTASASDLVDGSVPVICTPLSGSTFPLGTTTVSCSAKDNAGNAGSASFKVTVSGGVIVTLLSSSGKGLSGAVVQYYNGGLKPFGTTGSDGTAKMLLAAGTYNFLISYAGASQQKSQDVSKNPNVNFQTVLVTMKLLSSAGKELGGGAQYDAGGLKTFGAGTTTTTMELLPLTYNFQITYAGASQQKSQNVATNPTVVFQTVQVHSDSGKCTNYNAGGWKTFTQNMELLPGTYTFRFSDGTKDMSYTLVVGAVKHIH
jgi:hypothetical protein